jgi:HEPN domain-containing protein
VGALGLCLFITHHVVELGYKALYCENGVRPPKTHDLLRLHAEVLGAGWNLIIDPMDVALLNQYGVDARYPGFIIASITEVKDAQTASKRIYEAIRLELDKRPEAEKT